MHTCIYSMLDFSNILVAQNRPKDDLISVNFEIVDYSLRIFGKFYLFLFATNMTFSF